MASFSLVLLGEENISRLDREDGPIETLGACFFLTASVLFFASYFQSSGPDRGATSIRSKKNISYLVLALLFFIGFGEEISWGQRIIGWETPKYLQEINRQQETTLHNIRVFNSKVFFWGGNHKEERPFLSVILDVQTWFFLFWFTYCLVLPLINHYSRRFREYFSGKGVPLPPVWIGFLLLTNFLIFVSPYMVSYLIKARVPPMYHPFTEIRESNEAFIFAVLSLHELKKQLSKKGRVNERGQILNLFP
jgi:hypothetical protein